jgi:hypothetical protein
LAQVVSVFKLDTDPQAVYAKPAVAVAPAKLPAKTPINALAKTPGRTSAPRIVAQPDWEEL